MLSITLPKGIRTLKTPRSNTSNVSVEPDTINDGYNWAMIPEGKFTVRLPAQPKIQVRVSHGLEYPLATFELNLAEMGGQDNNAHV